MTLSSLLVALIGCPLLATLVMAVLPHKRTPQVVYECIHVVSVFAVLCLSMFLVYQEFVTGDPVMAFGLWFRLDSLSSIFVALIGIIGCLVGVFSIPYITHDVEAGTMDNRKVKTYYVFFSLFVFTMLLTATSNNIIMMWICVEATTLATVFLVGVYESKLSLEAAWKYVIVCTAGVAFGLYGTLLVYANSADVLADNTNAAFWTEIVPSVGLLDPMLVSIAFTFVVVGFGTKAGLFPMHTWLPDAHSEAPSPVSALLSGVLLKCAVLVIVRFYVIVTGCIGTTYPQIILIALGVLSVIVAAISVFSQSDLKRKLAYSSCENVGIVVLCLGFGGSVGIAAALLHCVFHGCTKALMFCLSGNALMKYGTRDLKKITGVLEVAPATAVLMMIGFFALSGFPPFAMFISEVTAFLAGISAGYIWVLALVALALTMVVAAFVQTVATSVMGKAPDHIEKKEVPVLALVPEVILACVIIWFGVALPTQVVRGVENATSIVLQDEAHPFEDGSLLAGLMPAVVDSGSESSAVEVK